MDAEGCVKPDHCIVPNPLRKSSRDRRSLRLAVAGWTFAASAALVAPAGAQQLPSADALERLPGQNAAQVDMARSIDAVCPTLVALGARNQLNTPQQQDLRDVCRRMVQTANDALGLDRPTGQSYGLSANETNNALQQINGEELTTPDAQIAEIGGIQTGNITSRLDAIRAGIAGPGISIAGLSMNAGEQVLAFTEPEDFQIVPAQWEDGGILSRLGLFVTGAFKFGDKEETSASDGFDFLTAGVTAGADYRVTDQLVVGAAFGYSNFDADFDNTPRSASGQDLDSDTYVGSLFGSYSFPNGPFIDGIASVGWGDYSSKRKIIIVSDTDVPGENETARGNFDAWHYGFAANFGWDIPIQAFTVTPIARVEYIRAEIDGFKEEGADGLNLEFDDHNSESLTTNLGVEATYSISTPIGVVVPSVRAEYVHDFLTNNNGPDVVYAADPTGLSAFQITSESADSDYGIVGAGVATTFPAGWAAFVDWNTFVGLSNFDIHTVNVGFRKSF
jgi:uncharacterized protein YhjY with autotransporter beta-barrel domain